jgi:hypothetical protein
MFIILWSNRVEYSNKHSSTYLLTSINNTKYNSSNIEVSKGVHQRSLVQRHQKPETPPHRKPETPQKPLKNAHTTSETPRKTTHTPPETLENTQ